MILVQLNFIKTGWLEEKNTVRKMEQILQSFLVREQDLLKQNPSDDLFSLKDKWWHSARYSAPLANKKELTGSLLKGKSSLFAAK